jgi:hypothetical protein
MRRRFIALEPSDAVALAGIASVALFVRCIQLGTQVPVFDEWHNLLAALRLDAGTIFTTFGEHSSIPLSLYYRALLDTVGLGGIGLRAPPLLAGLALVLAPYVVLPRSHRVERAAIAAVFALSPLLVYHSRFARIYSVATLTATASLVVGWHWWRQRRPSLGLAYAGLTAFTGFATLAHLAIATTPLLASLVALVFDARGRTREAMRRWAIAAAATAALLGALVAPAWLRDAGTIEAKLGRASTFQWGAVLRYATGAPLLGVGIAWILLALLGAASLWRTHRRLVLFALSAVALQVASVLALAPRRSGEGPIFARYALPAIVVALAAAALGIVAVGRSFGARVARRGAGRVAPEAIAVAVWLAANAWIGPLGALFVRPSAWANELLAMRLESPSLDPSQLVSQKPIYAELGARAPGSVTIVEAPYTTYGLLSPFFAYQVRHRQNVLVASEAGACGFDNTAPLPNDPALRLPGVVHLADPASLVDSGAELLIVHRMPMRELSYFRPNLWYAQHLRMSGEDCIRYAEERFGAPVYRDEDLAAFRLRPAEPGRERQ